MSSSSDPQPIPLARRTVLPYSGAAVTSAVTVRSCGNPMEAQLVAGRLTSAGIDSYLMNENANALGPYSGFCPIDVQVKKEDLERAREVLAQGDFDPLDVEPAAETAEEAADLAEVAVFDNPRALFDAAAVLGAARIDSFLPALAPRGGRPRGTGDRFRLRVRPQDLERARDELDHASHDRRDDADEDEMRCPHCGSWRVYPLSRPWPGILPFLFGGARTEERDYECLRCRARWSVP
jgi:hypothetical protein